MAMLALALGMVVPGAVTGQEPSSRGSDDIVVEGRLPKIAGGAWQLDRSATTGGRRGGGGPTSSRICVAGEDRAAVLQQLLALSPQLTQNQLCGRMLIRSRGAELSASQSCTYVIPPRMIDAEWLHGTRSTRIRAHLSDAMITAEFRVGSSMADGEADSLNSRWTLVARRVGPCATPSPTAATAAAPATVVPHDAPARLHEPAHEPGEAVIAPVPSIDLVGAAPPAQRDAPAPARTASDDILVVGRKLRKIRLHYAADGPAFRWCHADLSSGDARVDRIGCAIVRACVREGNDDRAAALACFYRKVDEVDPPPAS